MRIPTILILSASAMWAQEPPPPAFEVATIKPAGPGMAGVNISADGRVTLSGISLKALIAAAYQIPYQRVSGGESWMEKDQYTVDAKAPESANITNLRHGYWDIEDPRLCQMLQSLLKDRFQLKVRREVKTGDVYELVTNGKPLKLEQRSVETEDPRGTAGWAQIWVLNSISMPQLAKFASDYMVHAPVTDKTGLRGTFDYRQSRSNEDPPDVDRTDSFLRMLQEVGLKMEKSKGEIESIAIESASKPSDN